MRLNFFLALIIASLICVDCISAESNTAAKYVDNGFRQLRLPADIQEERGATDSITKIFSSLKSGDKIFAGTKNAKATVSDDVAAEVSAMFKLANVRAPGGAKYTDDQMTKIGQAVTAIQRKAGLSDDQVSKLSKIFTSSGSTLKATDNEVASMAVLVNKANAGDGVGLTPKEVTLFAKTFAAAQKSVQLTDDQVLKLSKLIADVKKTKATAVVSDDVAAEVTAMFKLANVRAPGGAKYTDDQMTKIGQAVTAIQRKAGLSDDQVSKLSKIFTSSGSTLKATDNEVASMTVLVNKANAGDGVGLTPKEVTSFAKVFAAAQKSAQLTDDQVLKLSKLIADVKKANEAAKVGL
ncbi:Putative RxLR effector [Phytophthora palmivora]|uniref:RxLR effector n=1 Tax=Phytophthora palmivora TaxID=4796 RepID=A0A2P4XZR7_9STRA|nr:Putative RxLR effector [Phytophthora palmivora]